MSRYPKPQEPTTDENGVATYNGRKFYSSPSNINPQENAELHYLRDLCAWQERQLRGYASWERSVNEALNTGDGAYRP
jgi:hypothetical protein